MGDTTRTFRTLRLSVPTQNVRIGRLEFKLYVQVSNKV